MDTQIQTFQHKRQYVGFQNINKFIKLLESRHVENVSIH